MILNRLKRKLKAAVAAAEPPKLKPGEPYSQKNTPAKITRAMYREYHQLPVQMNKVVCSNFHGKGFGCNPKYIVKELLNLTCDLDVVWLGGKPGSVPERVRCVPFNSEEAIREIATARVLIDNQMKFTGFVKRPDQFYINTWHGAIPLKKIGFDNPSTQERGGYYNRVQANFPYIDLMPSNSKFCTDMLRRAFRYNGPVLEQGCPRNDLFLHDQTKLREKIHKRYNIPMDKKIALYAPTFRAGKSLDAYQLDYQAFLKQMGPDWTLLIRLHPHVQKQAKDLTVYTSRIINASAYADMQELMAASDILITDYSNIMFEFMLTGRPCFLYATDIEEYREQRDYYFDIYHLPFPVATTTESLTDAIQNLDPDTYHSKCDAFAQEIQLHETGQAALKMACLIYRMTVDPRFDLEAEVQKKNG